MKFTSGGERERERPHIPQGCHSKEMGAVSWRKGSRNGGAAGQDPAGIPVDGAKGEGESHKPTRHGWSSHSSGDHRMFWVGRDFEAHQIPAPGMGYPGWWWITACGVEGRVSLGIKEKENSFSRQSVEVKYQEKNPLFLLTPCVFLEHRERTKGKDPYGFK